MHRKLEMVTAHTTTDKSTPTLKRRHEDEEEDGALEHFDEVDPAPTLSTGSVTSGPSASSAALSGISKKQLKLDATFVKQRSYQDNGLKAAEITNKLLYMIAKDGMPYQIVEKEGFKTFVKAITPLYKLPCRKTVTNMIEEKYVVMSNRIKSQLSNVEHLSITTDIWTDSLNVKSYLGVTCHFILNDEYKSIAIGVTKLDETHTSEYLQVRLVINDWEINKDSIIIVVSDSAANIKKAIRDAFGVDKHLACFAHSLNLVPANMMESDDTNDTNDSIKSICKKVKTIVKHFKKSVVVADKLRSVSDLKLVQSVETRWNSTYAMLDRFIELSEKIGIILLQFPTAPQMLTSSELQSIKEFAQLLKSFQDATNIVSGESYLTGSKIIPIVNTLRRNLQVTNPETNTGVRLKQLLLEQFDQRFGCVRKVSNLAIATILDPRFKRLHFPDKIACSHAINKIIRAVYSIVLNTSNTEQTQTSTQTVVQKTDLWSYHENLVITSTKSKEVVNQNEMPEELKYYLNQPPIPMKDCPLKFWNQFSNSNLSKLAKKYLTICATSVSSERLFSKAGRILNEDRNRLTGRLVF
ncbi:E3 SUMO-protein ligase ZBED1-like [Andrena cerasifolii]|uniref:E3 SUMO-protein ligase ZBED1-like n=1 Tax=Andrena cerasifolii TaxID=2819439 RepID=UPI00403840B9